MTALFLKIISEHKDKSEKFEYRRMVIDESGDGEFVEKSKNEELKKIRKRRDVSEPWDDSFDGPKKMAMRAAPVEIYSKRNEIPRREGDTEDDTSRLEDSSGEDERPDDSSEPVGPLVSEEKSEAPESGDNEKADEVNESKDRQESGESDTENESDEPEESAESGYTEEVEESGDEANQSESQELSMFSYHEFSNHSSALSRV